MHRSTWADGAAMVSQCPIVPGNSFKYVWDTSERGSLQAGTFWLVNTLKPPSRIYLIVTPL